MKRRRFETCSFFNFKSVIQILMQMRRFDSGGGVVRKRSLPFERFGFFNRNQFPVCFLESFTSFSLMQLIEKYSMKIMRTQLLEFEPPSFLVKLGHCRPLFFFYILKVRATLVETLKREFVCLNPVFMIA